MLRNSVRNGVAITVVADAASVGSDAGSIRHDATVIAAPVLRNEVGIISRSAAGRMVSNRSLTRKRSFHRECSSLARQALMGRRVARLHAAATLRISRTAAIADVGLLLGESAEAGRLIGQARVVGSFDETYRPALVTSRLTRFILASGLRCQSFGPNSSFAC